MSDAPAGTEDGGPVRFMHQHIALDYVLRVGSNPVNVGPGLTTDPETAPQETDSRGVTLAVMGALLAIAGFALLRSMRPPAHRRLLIRLAEIEESRDASGGITTEQDVERSRILARLRFGRS